VATATLALSSVAFANETVSVADQVRERQRQGLSAEHRDSAAKRRPSGRRSSESNLRQFVDRSGVMTFTNRPDKYERSKDFEPVSINYQPIVVPARYKSYSSPTQYTDANVAALISRYARLYGLEEDLVYAVIKAESNFNPEAVSRAGACGLMQLMPGTAAEMGVTRVFDPAQNIAGGTQYLSKMLSLFNGDLRLALAGYTAGPNAVKQHGGIPPYKETRDYVERVLRYRNNFANGGVSAKAGGLKSLRSSGGTRLASKAVPSPDTAKAFVVHFHSGLTQPADRVVDKDPYYYIEYGTLVYPVRKDLVKKIAES
jgi:soluble lytic murein transglycosylase